MFFVPCDYWKALYFIQIYLYPEKFEFSVWCTTKIDITFMWNFEACVFLITKRHVGSTWLAKFIVRVIIHKSIWVCQKVNIHTGRIFQNVIDSCHTLIKKLLVTVLKSLELQKNLANLIRNIHFLKNLNVFVNGWAMIKSHMITIWSILVLFKIICLEEQFVHFNRT